MNTESLSLSFSLIHDDRSQTRHIKRLFPASRAVARFASAIKTNQLRHVDAAADARAKPFVRSERHKTPGGARVYRLPLIRSRGESGKKKGRQRKNNGNLVKYQPTDRRRRRLHSDAASLSSPRSSIGCPPYALRRRPGLGRRDLEGFPFTSDGFLDHDRRNAGDLMMSDSARASWRAFLRRLLRHFRAVRDHQLRVVVSRRTAISPSGHRRLSSDVSPHGDRRIAEAASAFARRLLLGRLY